MSCTPGGAPAKKDERSLLTILLQECLKDRNVWLFAITYFFVYVVRQARLMPSLLLQKP